VQRNNVNRVRNMARSLVVVESPAKARTIKKFLGKEFEVKASMGHIKDLPEKELGVEIEHHFRPHYRIIKGKRKVIKELKASAQKVDAIYLAADPDREGEAIAWHVAQELAGNGRSIYRILFNEITQPSIAAAMEQPGSIDMSLVNAQQARRIMDRLVGYQVSPFLWRTLYRGLSAGRVQSVALRLICEREDLIEAFVPKEYWSIEALLQAHQGQPFVVQLVTIDREKAVVENESAAQSIIAALKDKPFVVTEIKQKDQKRNPPAPFITSTLQQQAARALRFRVQKTMVIAQQLYEGLDIGGESPEGLITYMRTDAPRVSQEAIDQVRDFIAGRFGKSYLPRTARKYKSKRGAQEAHEAIRPTSVHHLPEDLKPYLDKDQFRLYQLIWKRFVASQMNPARFKVTQVTVAADGHGFRASGTVPVFDGYLSVYQEAQEEKSKEEGPLPPLKKGEELQLLSLTPEQHFTKPSPRYSEATLVKALESEGIGRPSTYAQIITTIRNRKYVDAEGRTLKPTDLGKTVNRLLVENFPDVFQVDFTAKMEEELDRVETGEYEWQRVVGDFYGPFQRDLEVANSKKADLKNALQQETDIVCEKCGGTMVIKWGRNGRFLACSNFPECRNTKPLPGEEAQQETNQVCDRCGAPMVVKSGRFGRFLACSNYPECRNTKPLRIGVRCPREGCPGHLIERKTKTGRIFYGCSEYPTCRFATWDKPIDRACPHCGAKPLVEKHTKAKGTFYRCLSCQGEVSPEEVEEVEEAEEGS
jgi:DNA topoisomerase-1